MNATTHTATNINLILSDLHWKPPSGVHVVNEVPDCTSQPISKPPITKNKIHLIALSEIAKGFVELVFFF
jgi:hypothetical protein